MSSSIYKLCANCVLLKGAVRMCIYDLQRQQYYPVPESMAWIFNPKDEIDPDDLSLRFPGPEVIGTISQYLEFLFSHELVIEIDRDEAVLFPDLHVAWQFPAHVSNGLIDINGDTSWLNPGLLTQFDSIGCHYLQLRFFKSVPLDYIAYLLSLLKQSCIKLVDILFPDHNTTLFKDQVLELVRSCGKIRTATLHSSGKDTVLSDGKSGIGIVLTTRQLITHASHCGVIHPAYFSINIPHYTESLAHNTCLNRKISVDAEGYIKNCPSMREHFGHVSNTMLAEAIEQREFKRLWNVRKDEIVKCKDCEFRHICTDCRAYLADPDDIYAAPLKCGYDPYTCVWEDWSSNPLKKEAAAFYRIQNG